jgi:hypothetical protein
MVSSPPSATDVASVFVCECKDEYCSACVGLGRFKEHGGKQYCVLHYPGEERIESHRQARSARFREVLERKLTSGDFDFRGVRFPDDLDLRDRGITFNSKLDCTGAVFNGEVVFSLKVYQGGVDFTDAEFVKDVYFTYAQFVGDAVFKTTRFRSLAYFRGATFQSSASFQFATFGGEADFTDTTFDGETYFGYAACASYLKFSVEERGQGFTDLSSLSLEFANVENPERVSFNTVSLKPYWFIDVDSRKFDFANVTWINEPVGEVLRMLQEGQFPLSPPIASPPYAHLPTPHRRLAVAYRRLAINAEENQRYGEASDFRYLAMETRRQAHERRAAFKTLDWWYWLASGYGETIWQACLVLVVLWALFAGIYMFVGFKRWEPKASTEVEAMDAVKSKRDDVGEPLGWRDALGYSFGAITLQKPEPPPATTAARIFVATETVLGPVQAALLALAIRRKFMR